MRITLEANHAIKIADCLARCKKRLPACEIADDVNISDNLAFKILRKLSAAGLVISYKGTRGGYELARDCGEINLKDIIEAIDGPIKIAECQIKDTCTKYSNPRNCVYSAVFSDISEMVEKMLSGATLYESSLKKRPQKRGKEI